MSQRGGHQDRALALEVGQCGRVGTQRVDPGLDLGDVVRRHAMHQALLQMWDVSLQAWKRKEICVMSQQQDCSHVH